MDVHALHCGHGRAWSAIPARALAQDQLVDRAVHADEKYIDAVKQLYQSSSISRVTIASSTTTPNPSTTQARTAR